MAKGWHRESRRHALARAGVKTAVDDKPINRVPLSKNHNLTIEPTYVPRGSGNNPAGGKHDLHYKIKEWGYVFSSKERAEEYANTHIEKNGVIMKAKEQLFGKKKNKYRSWSEQLDKGTPEEKAQAYKMLESRGIY